MKSINTPELGILNLTLVPERSLRFDISPARSLQAAILRRLELVAPRLSRALHDDVAGAHSTNHPLAVSPLFAAPGSNEPATMVTAGTECAARVAAMTFEVAQALDSTFDPGHPLGREPLVLEHVPFHVKAEDTYWSSLGTYASLLTMAKPRRNIRLEFVSPTGFRTRRVSPVLPDPATCIQGYLRKWNAFSQVPLPVEPLMAYVQRHMVLAASSLHPADQRLGDYAEHGLVGTVDWQARSGPAGLLRQVNALVDFACYCGTGMKTALGMGQTRRIA